METIKGLTSIIIGCYNVADWLRKKRLSCILQQTYKDIEVILVDDGSTDDTPTLLQTFSAEDSRLRIITQPNGGLGCARNTGLDAARGEFVWFYDVDDEADLDLVEKNVKWMSDMETDLNIFSFRATTLETGLSEEVNYKNRLVEDNRTLHDIFLDELFFVRYGNGFAWNKFYRRSFLNRHHIRFGHQRIQQDEVFNLQIYPLIERVYVSEEPLYHYFIYEHGNTRSRYIPHRYDIHVSIYDGLTQFAKQWSMDDKRLQDYALRRLYRGMGHSILFNTFHPDSPLNHQEKKDEVLGILRHPKSRECINYRVTHPPKSLEQRLYLKAFQHQNYAAIRIMRNLFQSARKFKSILNHC